MTDSLHIVCPSCSTTNRVASAKLTEGPVCGRCKAALFQGAPVELNSAAFAKTLANSDLPVLIDFWAPWCAPCLQMAPQLASATKRLEPHVRVAKLDTQAHPDIGQAFAIRSIPTLAVFKGGKEIARTQGAMGAADILKFVASALQ